MYHSRYHKLDRTRDHLLWIYARPSRSPLENAEWVEKAEIAAIEFVLKLRCRLEMSLDDP